MTETEAKAIAERWGVLHYWFVDSGKWRCFSGLKHQQTAPPLLWQALICAHERVVELEAEVKAVRKEGIEHHKRALAFGPYGDS